MEKQTFYVPGISCQHCVRTVTQALNRVDGVKRVDAEADSKKVTVQYDAPADEATIRRVLDSAGYPAEAGSGG